MIAMKAFYTLILILLASTAYGQSNLPACQGSDVSSWSNCSGAVTFADGNKYVGEFKDDKANGQGTFTLANGTVEEGIWENNEFKYAKKADPPVVTEAKPPRQ